MTLSEQLHATRVDLWGDVGADRYGEALDALHLFAQATECPPGGNVVDWFSTQADRLEVAERTTPPSQPLAEGADAEKLRAAVADIAAERQRQVEKEKRSTANDDLYVEGELARGAVAYALAGSGFRHDAASEMWPARWHYSSWKPTTPRRDLVKAGALIVAEIERLDRQALAALQHEGGK